MTADNSCEIENDIFDRLRKGELSPWQAEAEAARKGVGPLLIETVPSSYVDPMIRAEWTYPMVLAWIMWRNPSIVRECDPEYRGHGTTWKDFVNHDGPNGFVLGGKNEPVSEVEIQVREAITKPICSLAWAKEDLRSRLSSSDIHAMTRSHGHNGWEITPIHENVWLYMHVDDNFELSTGPKQHYKDVRLRRDNVVRIWPAIGEETRQEPTPVEALPSWHVRPGERQSAWALRPDVVEEAERRVGGAKTKKHSVNGALAEMAAECGVSWNQEAIARARRI